MLIPTFILFLEQFQYLYFLYLIGINIITTLMIWSTLKQMFLNYFFDTQTFLYQVLKTKAYLPISIIAPAFNEEETIITSISSLLKLDFNEYEIIIVNDGSQDETLHQIIKHFNLHPVTLPIESKLKHKTIRNIYRSHKYQNLIVLDKENGGKSDALNAGINFSNYPLICCVDADTILEKDALLQGLERFIQDKRLIAVGGAIGVINGSTIQNHRLAEKRLSNNFLEGFQVLEYLRGFFAGRVGWQGSNGLILISGAFGIFKKDIILKIGGYRHTLGEDFDLLVRMRRYCYENKIDHRVTSIAEVLCWTQTPSDYTSLLKQRSRWQRGLLETLYHHKKLIFNPKYGIVGMISLPYFLFIEALGPIITFLGIFSLIILYSFELVTPYTILIFFLLEFIWGILLNIFTLYLDIFSTHPYKNNWSYMKLFLFSFLEPFIYKPILKAELFIATFNFMNTNWGEIKRKKL